MKCSYCGKDISNKINIILLNYDGDFVCDDECKRKYYEEKDHFLGVTLKDDKKFAAWLGVPKEWVRSD